MTNYDRIKDFDKEQLARFLQTLIQSECAATCKRVSCYDCVLDWLDEECEV